MATLADPFFVHVVCAVVRPFQLERQAAGYEVELLVDYEVHVELVHLGVHEARPVVGHARPACERQLHVVVVGGRVHQLAVNYARARERGCLVHGLYHARRALPCVRLVGVADVARDVHRHRGGLCHVDVEVGTVVEPVVAVAVVVVLVELLEQSALRERPRRDEVTHVFSASAYVHVVLCLQCGVFHDVVGPVGAREAYGVASVFELLYHFVREHGLAAVVGAHLVVEHGVLISRGLLNHLCRRQYAVRSRAAHARLPALAALCGYQYYAVGSPHAEHGRGRSVFQHGDALDVVVVDVAHRALNAVNLHQWLGVGPCALAAHEHARGVAPRLARVLHGGHSCELAGQHIVD